jgi:actin-related protein
VFDCDRPKICGEKFTPI